MKIAPKMANGKITFAPTSGATRITGHHNQRVPGFTECLYEAAAPTEVDESRRRTSASKACRCGD
jgi:hypothetical protein